MNMESKLDNKSAIAYFYEKKVYDKVAMIHDLRQQLGLEEEFKKEFKDLGLIKNDNFVLPSYKFDA